MKIYIFWKKTRLPLIMEWNILHIPRSANPFSSPRITSTATLTLATSNPANWILEIKLNLLFELDLKSLTVESKGGATIQTPQKLIRSHIYFTIYPNYTIGNSHEFYDQVYRQNWISMRSQKLLHFLQSAYLFQNSIENKEHYFSTMK